jgi:hypothetical protein
VRRVTRLAEMPQVRKTATRPHEPRRSSTMRPKMKMKKRLEERCA